MLLRFLFGNDIFISYSRKDGNLYATRLAEELASRGFTCIIDVYEGIPEAEIPRAVMRALRRSYQLVVVGTREAAASPNVAREIRDFPRIGRSRVVVGFDGSVEGAAWQKDIQGLAVQNEDSDALRTGPSQGIVDLVQASFRFKRQKQRLAISFWTTLATIALMLAGGGTWLWSMG
ncbi:MAG TPA: toll/interleukin-1 receptor domain-containing protein, partial [Thermoanaerobaculia bacterium]